MTIEIQKVTFMTLLPFKNKDFRLITFYQAVPDLLNIDHYENSIKFQVSTSKIIKKASYDMILEYGRKLLPLFCNDSIDNCANCFI